MFIFSTDEIGIHSQQSDLIPDALNWLTRTYFRFGSDPINEQLFLDVSKMAIEKYPASSWIDNIIFRLGRYYDVDKKDIKTALTYYQKLISNYPKSNLVESALWWIAWDSYRQGELKEAAKGFEKIRKTYLQGEFFLQSSYWEAKSAERLKDTNHASKIYRMLAEEYPFTYYGQLASEKLAAAGADKKGEGTLSNKTKEGEAKAKRVNSGLKGLGKGQINKQFQRIQDLILLGLYDYAYEEFNLLVRDHAANSALVYEKGRFLKYIGRYGDAIRAIIRAARVFRYKGQEANGLPREIWETIYPLGYWEELKKAAEQNGISPLLIAALIRHESLYDKEAVSHVGAIGLMQVMPQVYEKWSRLKGVDKVSPKQLLDPGTNIAVGSWLLAQELQYFKGELVPALMSYNAPRERVITWIENLKAKDLEEFIESISFCETRQFVKSVVQIYKEYKRIYEE